MSGQGLEAGDLPEYMVRDTPYSWAIHGLLTSTSVWRGAISHPSNCRKTAQDAEPSWSIEPYRRADC